MPAFSQVTSLTDEKLIAYMGENHPRWPTLVEAYGDPYEMVNLASESVSIANVSVKVSLVSEASGS
jgi:hypothetical protein